MELTPLSQNGAEAAGFAIAAADTLSAYVAMRFDNTIGEAAVLTALEPADCSPSVRSWARRPGFGIEIRSEVTASHKQDEMFGDLLKRFIAALAALETSAIKPDIVRLVVVQNLGPQYQGHGLYFSDDWLQVLASCNGSIDIDQYVVDAT